VSPSRDAAVKDDPISQFKLDSPITLAMGKRIAALGKPTLFVMEGGYAVGRNRHQRGERAGRF
jgi:acetoin utilization deacetylase AcuC-like enzyme